MVACIELLFKCDAVFMLDNWSESRGARIERFIAQQKKMEIFYQNPNEEVMKKLTYNIERKDGFSSFSHLTRDKAAKICMNFEKPESYLVASMDGVNKVATMSVQEFLSS